MSESTAAEAKSSAKGMSNARTVVVVVALYLSAICTMGDMVITPVVSNIYETFSEYPEWLINLGVTGPTLAGIPFCLLSGWMCDKFDKKKLMVVGFAIFSVCAIFGAAIENVYYWVAMRLGATGVAWGITMTTTYAIFADLFTDDVKHGKIVGWFESFQGLLSACLGVCSGLIASAAMWQDAYHVYLVAIPILLMLIFALPKMPPKHQEHAEAHAKKAAPKGWSRKLIIMAVQGALGGMCFFVNMYLISIFIADAGIGGSDFTGIVVATSALSTAVGALFFGSVYKRMRDAVILAPAFIIAVGFILLAQFQTPAATLVIVAIMSVAWPFWFCYFYSHCTEIVPAERQGFASGMVAICFGIATACSSYLLTGIMALTHAESSVTVWPIIGCIMLVIAIASVILYLVNRKSKVAEQAEA